MANAVAPSELSQLIGSIYDCVLEPDRWERALAQVLDALTCQTAVLYLIERHRGYLLRKFVGLPAQAVEIIEKQYANGLAVLAARAVSALPSVDQPHVMSRHMPPDKVAACTYFQEGATAFGLVDIIQYSLIHSPTHLAGLALGRHERHGIATKREIELGGLLLPHVRRAILISDVLDVRTIERTRMAQALDALRCGVVLTNTDATILHANRAAEQMLRNGGPIQGVRGALGAGTAAAAKELRQAIGLAAQDEAGLGTSGLAVRLTDGEQEIAVAHVLPLTGSDLRTRLQPAAVAAVFIGVPDGGERANSMAAAFGLTPAETRVLASLLAGRTLAETATALSIAPSTARTHLDAIFAKTGVGRQADLIRAAADLVPPTRANV